MEEKKLDRFTVASEIAPSSANSCIQEGGGNCDDVDCNGPLAATQEFSSSVAHGGM
jgi:hypothetical protein